MQSTQQATEVAARYVERHQNMLIDGRWVPAVSGATLDVENPATQDIFATVPAGDAADIDLAVAAARRTFDSGIWRRMPAKEKGRILWKLSDLIEAQIESLMHTEILDNGMPISRARGNILRAVDRVRYYAGLCTKIHGRTADVGAGDEFHCYTVREPVGVAGLIVPWNGPLGAVCMKAAPALAAGCSVVVKPAEQTPLTALRFGQLCLDAGVPPGVVNIVTGFGATAGAALVRNRGVDKISFTGSTAVGKDIVAASVQDLKRVTLELGGKSPVFVFDDADFDATIPACAAGIYSNSGQICLAGSRLYVQRKSFDRVVSGIAQIARDSRIGNGLDPQVNLGPLISRRQHERVMGYIEAGKAAGAELVAGGHAVGDKGYFVEPTLFVTPDPQARLMVEEIFGPVLTAMPFDDIDDLARLGNDTRYGLAAGVYTRDVSKAHRAARALQAGTVWINCYGVVDLSMPFGGYKESGWGRESSLEGLETYQEHKSVFTRL